jgi:hypothetical protein
MIQDFSRRVAENQLSSVKLDLVADALSQLTKISRTFQGISDTSVSALKEPLLHAGQELTRKVAENFRATVISLLQSSHNLAIIKSEDAEALLVNTYFSVNKDLLQEGRPIYRTWESKVEQHTPLARLETETQDFYREFSERFNARSQNPISFAAWIEQRLNGQLHCFSDGCGRVSRALACFVLIESDISYPRFESREQFFEQINLPFPQWLEGYQSRIVSSLEWGMSSIARLL